MKSIKLLQGIFCQVAIALNYRCQTHTIMYVTCKMKTEGESVHIYVGFHRILIRRDLHIYFYVAYSASKSNFPHTHIIFLRHFPCTSFSCQPSVLEVGIASFWLFSVECARYNTRQTTRQTYLQQSFCLRQSNTTFVTLIFWHTSPGRRAEVTKMFCLFLLISWIAKRIICCF